MQERNDISQLVNYAQSYVEQLRPFRDRINAEVMFHSSTVAPQVRFLSAFQGLETLTLDFADQPSPENMQLLRKAFNELNSALNSIAADE